MSRFVLGAAPMALDSGRAARRAEAGPRDARSSEPVGRVAMDGARRPAGIDRDTTVTLTFSNCAHETVDLRVPASLAEHLRDIFASAFGEYGAVTVRTDAFLEAHADAELGRQATAGKAAAGDDSPADHR